MSFKGAMPARAATSEGSESSGTLARGVLGPRAVIRPITALGALAALQLSACSLKIDESGIETDSDIPCVSGICGTCEFAPDAEGFDCGAAQPDDVPPPCTSVWRGTYLCPQGITALELSVSHDPETHELTALFSFSADPSNPSVPSGCFTMSGAVDPTSEVIRLEPQEWVKWPPPYQSIGLEGRLSAHGTTFAGVITNEACDGFELVRADGKGNRSQ